MNRKGRLYSPVDKRHYHRGGGRPAITAHRPIDKEIRVANAIAIQVEGNGALADLVKELEGQLDTATEALAWYADGTNYIAQVDARGRKQRPIMVLKAHRAEVALRKIGRWPVQP